MIPCKHCSDNGTDSGFDLKTDYGWYPEESEYMYRVGCARCERFTTPAKTKREAWDNWERENTTDWQPPFRQGVPDGAKWMFVREDGHGLYTDKDPWVEFNDRWNYTGKVWPAGFFPDVASGKVDWRETKRMVER